MDFFHNLFSSDGFMPHGMCYEWDNRVIFLHVISDAFIALAYYSIPVTLLYFVHKRKDLVFDWIFICFAIFIVACGTTHLMEIINIWHPIYWLSGAIKAMTAITSVFTAVLLVRLIPAALALPSPAQLRKTNEALEHEIKERTLVVEKIEALNEELRGQTGKLEIANRELETFAYSVSHDLRAPLRHIHGYVDLLREESMLDDSGNRYAKIISESARQMGILIDNLLSFSRMGRAAMNPRWTDTSAMVAEVRESLVLDLKNRQIEWNVGELPRVYVDAGLFRQVWSNLIENALKYSKNREKTIIFIGSNELETEYEFFIKDNGAGFDMKYADKLFGIFQRLHFKEEFEGNGIGLANVQRIISRHDGRTWAHGEVNMGATFYFTLPKKLS